MLRIGIIGIGHWGPNYARIFNGQIPGATLTACVDKAQSRLEGIRSQYPQVELLTDHREMIQRRLVDAVAICTTATTHRAIAEDCLAAGLDVLVEKPIAPSSVDAQAIIDKANQEHRILMVGHTFLFNPAVQAMKQYIESGQLGRVLYFHFQRTGLGPIRQDVNALWDLAPHDLSMLSYWLGTEPTEVVARGQSYLKPGCDDVVFLTLRYPGDVLASIHVSWLDPVKIRKATIVGDRRMAVFDDVNASEKLRLYDKGASYQPASGDFGSFVAAVRDGDILIPSLDNKEPLREQLGHFVQCVLERKQPVAGGAEGLSIVRVLEAAQADLDRPRAEAEVRR
jgi:predicted dehydrogenase